VAGTDVIVFFFVFFSSELHDAGASFTVETEGKTRPHPLDPIYYDSILVSQ
jgi:hypothetical protein